MRDIDQINETLNEYFRFKEANSPYRGNVWKTNGSVAIRCKQILDRLASLLIRFAVSRKLMPETVEVRAANGAAYYPRAPWIGFFYPGEEPRNGVYPVACFFEKNEGFYIACVESIDKPQEGFDKFCDLGRQKGTLVDNDIFERNLSDAEHVAFPAFVFRRGEHVPEDRLVAALNNALGIRNQFRQQHPRRGQMVIGVDAVDSVPDTVGSLFEQFETIKRSFSDMMQRQSEMSRKYDENEKNTNRLLGYIEDLKRQTDVLDDSLKNARNQLTKETSGLEQIYRDRLKQFIESHEIELDKLRKDLASMLGSATAGLLSSHFDAKRRVAEAASKKWMRFFVGSLVLLLIVGGGYAYLSFWFDQSSISMEDHSTKYYVVRAMTAATIYAPLLWLACHLNRCVVQTRRLAEEYAHKVVVARTYVGLSSQMSRLLAEQDALATSMSTKLLEATIETMTSNPNHVLDKAKTTMPLTIIAEDLSKIAKSVVKIKEGAES